MIDKLKEEKKGESSLTLVILNSFSSTINTDLNKILNNIQDLIVVAVDLIEIKISNLLNPYNCEI